MYLCPLLTLSFFEFYCSETMGDVIAGLVNYVLRIFYKFYFSSFLLELSTWKFCIAHR